MRSWNCFGQGGNQYKNNFRFTTLTKHMNNRTSYLITLEKLKKYGSVSYFSSCRYLILLQINLYCKFSASFSQKIYFHSVTDVKVNHINRFIILQFAHLNWVESISEGTWIYQSMTLSWIASSLSKRMLLHEIFQPLDSGTTLEFWFRGGY